MNKISPEVYLDFKDVSIKPVISDLSSRSLVNLVTTHNTKYSHQTISGIPIISANMSSVTTFDMASALTKCNMFAALHKHYSIDELVNYFNSKVHYKAFDHVFYTLGMQDTDFDKLILFSQTFKPPKLICIDVANGYMKAFHAFISKVRYNFPDSIIMAGNVVTPEGVEALDRVGVDIVKVGIGSSSVCRTRTVAGVGIPQLSAILECSEVADALGVLLCSDGGCNESGDFSKAFCAGADFVMSGTMFSGHDECGGNVIDGKMEFYGMSSETAMNKHHGGMSHYRASEGIRTLVPMKGPVKNTVNSICGGLRSTGTYINESELQNFSISSEFKRVNRVYNNIFGD